MATFQAWFRSLGKSAKSAGKYTQALTSTLTRMAEKHGIHRGDLLEVVDQTAFDSIAMQLKALKEFQELNERGKSMYSAALNNYAKYLEQLDHAVEPLPEITASEFSDFQSQVQQNIERSRATDPVKRRRRLADAPNKPKQMSVQTTVYSRNADVIQEVLERFEGDYSGLDPYSSEQTTIHTGFLHPGCGGEFLASISPMRFNLKLESKLYSVNGNRLDR